jgi:hypothetical protein
MKYSKEKLLDSIKNCEFYELQGLGLNEKVNFMKNFFNDVVESMSVEKYVNHKDCDNEWYDLECVNMKNEKDYRKFIYSRNKTENNWKTYKLKRNTYKKILRSKHSNFYRQRILKYNNNPKKLWKILKSLYKDKSNRIKMIKFGNNEICDTLEIAVKLNDYYIDSIDCILNSITQVSNEVFDRFIERNDCCFKFKKINQDDIKIILKKNINKTSVDKISGRMLLDSMENTGFADFFVELINQSLMQGEVPEMWKIAIIEPIEKVKNAIKPEEFRPINKLPVAEKVLEVVVKDQLEEFLKLNDILTEEQSGFRKNHSCESTVNFVLHNWKTHLEEKKIIITVSLDFKRAFETINREVLLNIMERYGIRSTELKWFIDYFKNRKQIVKIDDSMSHELNVNHGVSQGSCLGPLTYLLMVNYLPKIIKNCSVHMFADDTLISVASCSFEDAIIKLNNDLEILYNWINFSKLALNINKTKFMIITHKKKIDYDNVIIKIGENIVERVHEIKYLGIIIDDKLTFNSHMKYIQRKLYYKLAMMRRISGKLNAHTKIMLYNSLVAPHFDYCSSILFCLPQSKINELQKIQNKFMRNILKVNKYARIKFMLDALKFQSVNQRLAFNSLKLLYKIENGMAPNYLKKLMKKNKSKYTYNLRRKSLYDIPHFTKEVSQKSLFFKSLKIFNECKETFKNEDFTNVKSFTKKLKQYVLKKF